MELRMDHQSVRHSGRRGEGLRIPEGNAEALHLSQSVGRLPALPDRRKLRRSAGIANMLAQDRNGKVTLLPAIPKEWKNGSVRGLRIKNGRAVDIRWENGEIVESRIYPVED